MRGLPRGTELTAAALPSCAETWEPRPRDFQGNFVRGGRRRLQRRRRRWTLVAAGLVAIALPAFASPPLTAWDSLTVGAATAADQTVLPMPFEQVGASFPGSAYYYLEAEKPVLKVGEGIHSDAGDAASVPVARAFRIDNSGVDRSRALQCLTAAIYYEAASEPDGGQRAVAQVVLNRVAHPAYPKTVCGVVYQGSERPTGCQFSFTCDGSLARAPQRYFWQRAEDVARAALSGYVYAPIGLATHYHTIQVNPYWAPSLRYLTTIGAHRFYAFNGAPETRPRSASPISAANRSPRPIAATIRPPAPWPMPHSTRWPCSGLSRLQRPSGQRPSRRPRHRSRRLPPIPATCANAAARTSTAPATCPKRPCAPNMPTRANGSSSLRARFEKCLKGIFERHRPPSPLGAPTRPPTSVS